MGSASRYVWPWFRPRVKAGRVRRSYYATIRLGASTKRATRPTFSGDCFRQQPARPSKERRSKVILRSNLYFVADPEDASHASGERLRARFFVTSLDDPSKCHPVAFYVDIDPVSRNRDTPV